MRTYFLKASVGHRRNLLFVCYGKVQVLLDCRYPLAYSGAVVPVMGY